MTVNTFTQTSSALSRRAWSDAVDGDISVFTRIAVAFAPHEEATPAMTVRLDAGYVFDGTVLTEVAAQSTAAITAPTINPRIDRVVIDNTTGAVSVVTGTEAASPVAPAIPAGKLPVAQVSLLTSTTAITNAEIIDERSFLTVGSSSSSSPGVDQTASDRAMINALDISAGNGLSWKGMINGFVDSFVDEAGVDSVTSTNETHIGGAGAYATGGSFTDLEDYAAAVEFEVVPSSLSGGAGNFIDNDLSSKVYGGGASSWSVFLTFHQAMPVTKARMYVINTDAGRLSSINFHGWDGSTWVSLGNLSPLANATWAELTGTWSYTSYKFTPNPSGGGGPSLSEVELQNAVGTTPASMVLVSNAQTALTVPTAAHIVIQEEDVDAVILNTDLKAYASRDGGTTWTQGALSDVGDGVSGQQILAADVDLTSQPSGTSMKYKIETLNTKGLKLHGVALEWS